jgi:hypothetical protein
VTELMRGGARRCMELLGACVGCPGGRLALRLGISWSGLLLTTLMAYPGITMSDASDVEIGRCAASTSGCTWASIHFILLRSYHVRICRVRHEVFEGHGRALELQPPCGRPRNRLFNSSCWATYFQTRERMYYLTVYFTPQVYLRLGRATYAIAITDYLSVRSKRL